MNHSLVVFLAIIFVVILILGIFFNTSILAVILSSRLNRHKISNLYLVQFLIIDVISCIFISTYNLVTLVISLPRSDQTAKDEYSNICKASIFFVYGLSVSKLLALMFLSFERFFALRYPYQYTKYATRRVLYFTSILILVQSVATVLPATLKPDWISYFGEIGGACGFNWGIASIHFVVPVITLDFVIPALTILFTNVSVFIMARRQRRKHLKKLPNSPDSAATRRLGLAKTLVKSVGLMETSAMQDMNENSNTSPRSSNGRIFTLGDDLFVTRAPLEDIPEVSEQECSGIFENSMVFLDNSIDGTSLKGFSNPEFESDEIQCMHGGSQIRQESSVRIGSIDCRKEEVKIVSKNGENDNRVIMSRDKVANEEQLEEFVVDSENAEDDDRSVVTEKERWTEQEEQKQSCCVYKNQIRDGEANVLENPGFVPLACGDKLMEKSSQNDGSITVDSAGEDIVLDVKEVELSTGEGVGVDKVSEVAITKRCTGECVEEDRVGLSSENSNISVKNKESVGNENNFFDAASLSSLTSSKDEFDTASTEHVIAGRTNSVFSTNSGQSEQRIRSNSGLSDFREFVDQDEYSNLTRRKRLRLLSLPQIENITQSESVEAMWNIVLSTLLVVIFHFVTYLPFIISRLVETFTTERTISSEVSAITAAINNADVVINPLIILCTRGNFRKELKTKLSSLVSFCKIKR